MENETGLLEKVLVHRPGPELDAVQGGADAAQRILVEDVIDLGLAREEHDRFTDVLRAFAEPGGVVEILDLLGDVCRDDAARRELVAAVTALEGLGVDVGKRLLAVNPAELPPVLVSGVLPPATPNASPEYLFHPLPNLVFTRDLMAEVPGGIVLGHPAMQPRHREGLLAQYVARHPRFANTQILDIRNHMRPWQDRHFSDGRKDAAIEGGDVLVVDAKTLMVGTGERTSQMGLDYLLRELLAKGSPIERVIEVVIPADRASMHLDTVFTFAGDRRCLVNERLISDATFFVRDAPFKEAPAQWDFPRLLTELRLTPVVCGGTDPVVQSREQWREGANGLLVAPNVLVAYAHNTATIGELASVGYRVISARDDLEGVRDLGAATRRLDVNAKQMPTVITVPGQELVRFRGGPRCMTGPLQRRIAAPSRVIEGPKVGGVPEVTGGLAH